MVVFDGAVENEDGRGLKCHDGNVFLCFVSLSILNRLKIYKRTVQANNSHLQPFYSPCISVDPFRYT